MHLMIEYTIYVMKTNKKKIEQYHYKIVMKIQYKNILLDSQQNLKDL